MKIIVTKTYWIGVINDALDCNFAILGTNILPGYRQAIEDRIWKLKEIKRRLNKARGSVGRMELP